MTTPIGYMRAQIKRSLDTARAARLHVRLDEQVLEMLESLAAEGGLTKEALASSLLAQTVRERYQAKDENMRHWELLSEREKQVAALACLEYTNPRIALRLYISKETVKTHMKNILRKFELKGRGQLRWVLKEWDFSAYEAEPPNQAPPAG